MTDKELLELAAKAAGFAGNYVEDHSVFDYRDRYGDPVYSDPDCGILIEKGFVQHVWNPLTDDGDALRLAVKLNMLIDPNNGHVTTCTATGGFAEAEECTSECKYAATRRAIVRAAAAIGANECAT